MKNQVTTIVPHMKTALFKKFMKENSVERIEIEFDGSGDSGSIESARFVFNSGDKDDSVEGPRVEAAFKKEFGRSSEDLGCDIASSFGDWQNNEGGFGTVCIDDEGNITTVFNTRTTSYETEEFNSKITAHLT